MRSALFLLCTALLFAQPSAVDRAWDLVAQDKREEAVRLLTGYVQAKPRDVDARLLLGSLLAESGDQNGSILHLKEAVQLRPDSAIAHNALGEAYRDFGQPKAARAEFETAVRLDPGLSAAQESLAVLMLQANEFAAAAPHLDRAIQAYGNSPESAYAHYLRAKVYTQENEIEKAAKELTTAVTLRPDFAEAWSDLGEARRTLLDDAGAFTAFERAAQLSPEDAIIQYRLGAAYLKRGDARQAVAHLRKSVEHNPDNQSALYSLQLALLRDGRPEEAARVKQQLAELLRNIDRVSENALKAVRINNEGAKLEKAGKLREAAAKYRSALALDPDHVGIRTNLAIALLRLGEWKEGLAELRESIRRDPENPKLQRALEDALRQAPAGVQ